MIVCLCMEAMHEYFTFMLCLLMSVIIIQLPIHTAQEELEEKINSQIASLLTTVWGL